MKCTECGKDFEPDCAQEEICKACQYEDVPEASMQLAEPESEYFDPGVMGNELLAELRTANPGWDKWRKARVAAGLTLRQAAKILEVAPSDLSAIERGEQRPSEMLAARMARCYGGDQVE
jgi:DNA-binding XRE family transcriptional regulator